MSPQDTPGRERLQSDFSLAVQEGLLAITGPPKVQRRVEHAWVKALVTKSSEPTHTKDKVLVTRRVPTEAMVDAEIMRQNSGPVLLDTAG